MLEMMLISSILLLTFGLLIFSKLPPPAIFVGALTLTITFGLAPLEESLKGFNNPGVLTIGALFMIAAGMYSTGAVSILSEKLIGRPQTVPVAQMKILPHIAFGSAFLNNTPLVAMMIPVIRDLARSCCLDAKKLYLPLSYASILGGTCTLIGTATNLVIGGMIERTIQTGDSTLPHMVPVSMFTLTWIGLPITVFGLASIMLFGRWLLPRAPIACDPIGQIQWRCFRIELAVDAGGPLVGKTLEQAGLIGNDLYQIICYHRGGMKMDYGPDTIIGPDDAVGFATDIPGAKTLWSTMGLQPIYSSSKFKAERHRHHLVEAVISRRNSFLGHRIGEIDSTGHEFDVWLVGMARGRKALEHPLRDAVVEAGDIALLEVRDTFFFRNHNEVEFSLTKKLGGAQIQRTDKALIATCITVTMVFSVAIGWMSMLNAALLAAGAMLLTGCMDLSAAGKSIDFSTLVVIASAMGLEAAVTDSGLSAQIGSLLGAIGGDNAYLALAVIFLGCIAMDAIVTNVASAVFMFPIALNIAQGLGVSFMPFAITVMVGASCSFISPVSYQTNLMVYGPGEYRFLDFVRAGIPLSILVGVLTILLTPLVFPFSP